MGKLLFSVMVIIALLLLAGCRNTESIEEEVSAPSRADTIKITPHQAEEKMHSNDVIILDVRTQEEFDAGHIENAILIPYDEISDHVGLVLSDTSQTILIYCRTGRRSAIAATLLIEFGFTSVYDFGGIVDWHGEVVLP